MDPVTLIQAALAAGAVAGVGESATAAVKDAYTGLRGLVARRLAGKPSAEVALAEHEQDPDTWAPAGQTGPEPSCGVSFSENHWRGLADHHTMAFTHVVTHAVRHNQLHHKLGRHLDEICRSREVWMEHLVG